MNIFVDDSAIKWLKSEFGLSAGDAIRIMTRYGDSSAQPGFALTLSVEPPRDVAAQVKKDDITLFVKDADAWYFDGHDVHVHYDKDVDELSFDVPA